MNKQARISDQLLVTTELNIVNTEMWDIEKWVVSTLISSIKVYNQITKFND